MHTAQMFSRDIYCLITLVRVHDVSTLFLYVPGAACPPHQLPGYTPALVKFT